MISVQRRWQSVVIMNIIKRAVPDNEIQKTVLLAIQLTRFISILDNHYKVNYFVSTNPPTGVSEYKRIRN